MNDNDLITTARQAFTGVRFTTPEAQVVQRGRMVRARRRIPVATAALAVIGGTALALTGLLPSSAQAGHRAGAEPTAWTVVKQADGNIRVTIRELRNPSGLQGKLRADGVPASVTFARRINPACRPYPRGTPGQPPHNTQLLHRVFPRPYQHSHGLIVRPGPARSVVAHRSSNRLAISPNVAVIVIDPSALPANAGVQIATVSGGQRGVQAVEMPAVIYASQRCTGT